MNQEVGVYFRPDSVAVCFFAGDNTLHTFQEVVPSSDAWAGALQLLVSRHKLKRYRAKAVVSSDFYQQLQIEKPKVADHELTGALPFAIRELVSDSINDLVMDYYDVPPVPMMPSKLNVVVSQKAAIKHCIYAVAKAELDLQHISVEELALANLLQQENETLMLVNQQNGDEVLLSVVRNGALHFSRRLRGFRSLAESKAQDLEGALLDNFSLELQRSLDYIVAQLKLADVSQVLLAIPCDDPELLASRLTETLGRNVQVFKWAGQLPDYNMLPAVGAVVEV